MPDSLQPVLIRPFRAGDETAIALLKCRAIAAGELPGEREADVARWTESLLQSSSGVFVAERPDDIVGFIDVDSHILVVDPGARRHGIGKQLVEAAEQSVDQMLLWLPERYGAAAAFLDSIGYVYYASLWEMTLSHNVDSPNPGFPEDLHAAQWTKDVEVDEFVSLFNDIFSDHPTPLSVTRELVIWAHERADPSTTLELIVHAGHSGGPLIGFTRVRLDRSSEETTGEIEFIGVSREWRGRGLGRALLDWGIDALRARGAGTITLRVESQNVDALRLYERTGFVTTREWRRYTRAAG